MSNAVNDSYNFKVVLVGEGCVGKTSIILRYVEDKFNTAHITTLQASFLAKKINLNGKRVHLNIWDTAGQERFHALGPIYYRGSHGAVLVFDVTDEDSFLKVKNWVKELRKMLGSDVVLAIVGNKIDMVKERIIESENAESYAESVGAQYFETSAKNNEGIEELFLKLSMMMIDNHNLRESRNSLNRSGSMRQPNTLIIDENDESSPDTQNSFKCCNG